MQLKRSIISYVRMKVMNRRTQQVIITDTAQTRPLYHDSRGSFNEAKYTNHKMQANNVKQIVCRRKRLKNNISFLQLDT